MAGEAWRVLGQSADVPVYITGAISTTAGPVTLPPVTAVSGVFASGSVMVLPMPSAVFTVTGTVQTGPATVSFPEVLRVSGTFAQGSVIPPVQQVSGTFASGSMAFYEATFGDNTAELLHYQTNFAAPRRGLETTGAISASPCRLYELTAVNRSGSTIFLQIYNATNANIGTSAPLMVLPIHSASERSLSWRTGYRFSTALTVAWSTERDMFTGSADAGWFMADYKA